jgi:Beta protein
VPLIPDFGDYGPASPAMPSDIPFAPLPNLRYSAADSWQVYREQKVLPGNESFYTLCQRVVQSNHWCGSGYSWGDGEIDRCSKSIPGPGTATEWRSYGTSHHLAHVVDRLATIGAP